jgi:hypothetical protein
MKNLIPYYEPLREHLNALLSVAAEEARKARDWPDTRDAIQATTYPITAAFGRIDEGWTVEQIMKELDLRLGLGSMPQKGLTLVH